MRKTVEPANIQLIYYYVELILKTIVSRYSNNLLNLCNRVPGVL